MGQFLGIYDTQVKISWPVNPDVESVHSNENIGWLIELWSREKKDIFQVQDSVYSFSWIQQAELSVIV